MRKTLRASVLTLALCAPVFAGDIPNPSGPQTPPQRVTAEEQATHDTIQDETPDGLTETVLSLLERVLALL